MTIYEHKTSLTASAGSTSTTTLRVRGGLLRQVLITANTSSTVFRANIQDEDGINRLDWGFSTGQLNEVGLAFPIVNSYRLNITNASPNDTFTVRMSVQE